MTIERLFTGVLALACLGLVYVAWGYTASIAYDPIGPRPYPLLVFSLLALGSFIIALRPSRFSTPIDLGLTPLIVKNLTLCTVAFFIYGAVFELLGFPVATAVMSLAVGMLFGGNWKKSLIFSIIMGISLYLLFDKGLDVNLPLGSLFGQQG